jgi:hypothetical protein
MEGKKSIIEETLADFELIENQFNSNTKEILRSVSKEEITSTLNESLREDDFDDEYDISDVGSDDGDVDALPVDAPMGGGDEELPVDGGDELGLGGDSELPIDGGDELGLGAEPELGLDAADGDLGLGADIGSDDYEMDMTGASDEDVISVYKKLSGEDEIEVVSPSEVIITDPVSGAEYNVKLGGGSMIDQGEMGIDGELGGEPSLEPEIDAEPELGLGADDAAPIDGIDAEPEAIEEPVGGEPAGEEAPEGPEGPEAPEEEEEEEEEENFGESVVYEVELSEEAEEVAEDIIRGKGHDKELVTATPPNTGDIEGQTAPTHDGTKAVKPGSGGEGEQSVTQNGPNTGDIEGQTAPNDSDSGDNLVGGFKDDGQTGTGDNHAKHIMEDEAVEESTDTSVEESAEVVDESAETVDEEVVEEDAIEEKIASGIGMSIGKHRNQSGPASIGAPDGPGAKVENVVKKYNALLAEAKKIKEENVMFRNSLKGFRKMLGETAVFNSNLTYVTKLFLEHSTTTDEKQNILERFDNEVVTIEESKRLYKSIVSEMRAKKPIMEAVENKIISEQSSGQSTQLNETKVYVDPAQRRIMDLINRTKNR